MVKMNDLRNSERAEKFERVEKVGDDNKEKVRIQGFYSSDGFCQFDRPARRTRKSSSGYRHSMEQSTTCAFNTQ